MELKYKNLVTMKYILKNVYGAHPKNSDIRIAKNIILNSSPLRIYNLNDLDRAIKEVNSKQII